MPTSTLPSGVRVSRFVTVTTGPVGPVTIANARSGAPAVAMPSGVPSTGTVMATAAIPTGTTESERSSRFAVTTYSPLRNGSESTPGAGDGDGATAAVSGVGEADTGE